MPTGAEVALVNFGVWTPARLGGRTARVADEQGLDDVARLLADGEGVGQVVGARPGSGPLCDLELLVLTRAGGGYRLRSIVAELDRIHMVGDHLFDDPAPETFIAEDVAFESLEDVLRSASGLIAASSAVPIPGRTRWLAAVGFTHSLSRSELRSEIGWLPQPPRWWEITKKVLTWAVWVVVFGAFWLRLGVAHLLLGRRLQSVGGTIRSVPVRPHRSDDCWGAASSAGHGLDRAQTRAAARSTAGLSRT